jgi:hypothetical protein
MNEKKVFDPSKKFTIYGSWMQNFTELKEYGAEVPYTLFEAIADYAMFGTEPDFSTFQSEHGHDNKMLSAMLRQLFIAIKPNIDTSIKRSRANFAPDKEVNERELMVWHYRQDHPEKSLRDIAAATGVSKTTVDRILKKYGGANQADEQATCGNALQQSGSDNEEVTAELIDDDDELPF